MPFAMTHLCISNCILKSTDKISKPCEFILGSLAPDSVHFRPNYSSEMKKISHLCIGDEKWGRISNNSEWTDNVLSFLELNKHSENFDFILGYCTHILADIRNNIKIWTPYRLKHQSELDSGLGSLLHKEAAVIDNELYLTLKDRNELWDMLKQSEGIDVPGIVNKHDIDKMKINILYNQFKDIVSVDLSINKYLTIGSTNDFIESESEYIKEQLEEVGIL